MVPFSKWHGYKSSASKPILMCDKIWPHISYFILISLCKRTWQCISHRLLAAMRLAKQLAGMLNMHDYTSLYSLAVIHHNHFIWTYKYIIYIYIYISVSETIWFFGSQSLWYQVKWKYLEWVSMPCSIVCSVSTNVGEKEE